MDWLAARTYLAALDADARRTLLGILTSAADVPAGATGRLSVRDDGADLVELLIELEEKDGRVSGSWRDSVRRFTKAESPPGTWIGSRRSRPSVS